MFKFIQISLVIFGLVSSNIHIWSPRSLKRFYSDNNLEYTVSSFGSVPYGRTIYGTVVKAHPINACAPIADLEIDKTQGPLIVLVERGTCHFAEKVLNAQKAGASMVMIGDSINENIENIIVYEGSEDLVNQILIPSILIPKKDAENFLNVIDSQSNVEEITLAVEFNMIKSKGSSKVKMIIQIDDSKSLDTFIGLNSFLKNSPNDMKLDIFYRIFDLRNIDQTRKYECFKNSKLCVLQESEELQTGIMDETMRQLCILNSSSSEYFEFIKAFKSKCFNSKNKPVKNLAKCSKETSEKTLSFELNSQVMSCLNSEKALHLAKKNLQSTRYDIFDFTPLIYINDFMYKGKTNDIESLVEAFCASFEQSPALCYSINRSEEYKALQSISIYKFLFLSSLISMFIISWAVLGFYFIYKKKIRSNYKNELNSRIAKAINKYRHRKNEDYKEFVHVV